MSYEIDPVTLRPVERESDPSAEYRRIEEEKLERAQAEGLKTEVLLKSPEGQVFIEMVKTSIETRIDQLLQADPQAQALLKLFDTLGGKVKFARAAAERLSRTRLGMEGESDGNPMRQM